MKILYQFVAAITVFIMAGSCTDQQDKGISTLNNEKSQMPFITENGIGDLKLGANFVDCLESKTGDLIPSLENLLDYSEMKYGFYNKTAIKLINFTEGQLYLLLFSGNDLMAALDFGSGYSYNGQFMSETVSRIIVYSPKLKMANGIHTGMSAKELVEDFGAEIKYEEGSETEVLSFSIADMPSNIILKATAKSIDRGKIDSEFGDTSSTDFILQLDDVEDCKLSAIVIQ